ncbi:MAG: diguanylate cyclase [Candidatus Omnitrophica bacterium]|nr:diguanylate cyclase [Candidatus Omnitrophota bacterium]
MKIAASIAYSVKIIFKATVVAILLTALYINILMPMKVIRIANLKISDALFSIVYKYRPLPLNVMDKMVLIAIDDASYKEMDLRWPWPRGVIAGLIQKISACSPILIYLDLGFIGKSPDPEQDLMTAKAIRDAKNVYGGAFFSEKGAFVGPEEIIANSMKGCGYVNMLRDSDNSVRRMNAYTIAKSDNMVHYSLPIQAAADIMGTKPIEILKQYPRLKSRDIYINYFGGTNRFLVIPAWKIFKWPEKALAGLLKNKMVFVGITSESLHDIYPTPLGLMNGVVMNMNGVITYITGDSLVVARRIVNYILIFIFVFIAILAGIQSSLARGVLIYLLELIVFIMLSLYFFLNRIMIDYFGVFLLVTVLTVLLYIHKYVTLLLAQIALRREAITDELTGLYIYRYFKLSLEAEFAMAKRSRRELSMVFFDIDHFKNINDTYGHEFGNVILKAVAKTIRHCSRKDNILTRYGGEEFCILMPGTEVHDAVKYAERVRNEIKTLEFKSDKSEDVKITISGGVVSLENNHAFKESADFTKAADAALYYSKENGRDKISVFNKGMKEAAKKGG